MSTKNKTYRFSSINFKSLMQLVDIKQKLDAQKFNHWFNNKNIVLDKSDVLFLQNLILRNIFYIKQYKEEALKIKFISQVLTRVNFSDYNKKICDFYDEVLTYRSKKFTFTGKTDFMVSKGYFFPEKPYFFIQEFKPSNNAKDPQPQLLAELIAAVELNNITIMKGAFIVGEIWNFIILEKLATEQYQYFISKNYVSTDLKDMQQIYKNLVFVKQEIFDTTDNE